MQKRSKYVGSTQVQILPPRLKKLPANTEFVGQFQFKNNAGGSAGGSAPKLMPPDMPVSLPYKKCRLIIPPVKAEDQRWYIIYYCWSADKNKLVRVRDRSVNKIENLSDRKRYAKMLMRHIDDQLIQGYHIDSVKLAEQKLQNETTSEYLTTLQAIDKAMQIKQADKIKSLKNYTIAARVFTEWLVAEKLSHTPVKVFTKRMAENFMTYVSLQRDLSGRAYNNYLAMLKHLFKILLDKELIDLNPFTGIPEQLAGTGRNLAFTIDEQRSIIEYMRSKYPEMLRFCQVMYYTLMRTKEITHMQAGWIGMYNKHQIYLPAYLSKNGRERHITIPPQLEEIIKEAGWRKLPKDTYIFSSGFRTGKKLMQSKKLASRFRLAVLDKLAFSKDYTMYSWKHTGVVSLYRNNVTRASIRMQAGFLDDKSFEAYLKSLGLFENTQIMTSYPSLPV